MSGVFFGLTKEDHAQTLLHRTTGTQEGTIHLHNCAHLISPKQSAQASPSLLGTGQKRSFSVHMAPPQGLGFRV